MTIQTHSLKILYDRDYYLWLETTIDRLQRKQLIEVDRDKVIEELESVGRSEKRALES